MSTTHLDLIFDAIATIIEGLTPSVAPTVPTVTNTPFARSSDYRPFFTEETGNQNADFDRTFSLLAANDSEGPFYGQVTSMDVESEMQVVILYQPDLDLTIKDFEKRWTRDRAQVRNAILKQSPSPTGVRLISYDGSVVSRNPTANPNKFVVQLNFRVKYRSATT